MHGRNFGRRSFGQIALQPALTGEAPGKCTPVIGDGFGKSVGSRLPLTSNHVRFAAAMVGCAVYLLPLMRVLLPRTDEGTFLEGATRLVHGQVFARDFMEVMGPGTFYWLAMFFRAFGTTIFASRVCLFVSWMTTAIVVYALSRHVRQSNRLLPLTLIVVTGFSSLGIGISHHIDSNCLALLTVLLLRVWCQSRHPRWLVFAGGCAALTALVHQPKGLLLLVAAGLWIWIQGRKERRSIGAFPWLVAGFAGIAGCAALYFAAHGALTDLIRASCVWPFQHYSVINKVPYAYGTFAFNWRGAPLGTPSAYWIFPLACLLLSPFLLVVILPGLVILQLYMERLRPLPPDISLYLFCGLAVWVSELHRKDIVHLVFGSPLLIILSVQLLSWSELRLPRLGLVVLTASTCALAACNLIVALTAHTVSTRAGNVAMLDSGEEFAALNARLVPGEEILAYPYCPSYYFLTQTNNPARFSILQSGYNTPGEVMEVIHVLESRKVSHVVWDTNFKKRSLALVFPAALRLPDDLAPLDAYLRDHYFTIYSHNGFQILERRREPNNH